MSDYTSVVERVWFHLAGTADITEASVVPVVSQNLFHNNLPFEGGAYNAHLGSTDLSYKCQTCHNSKRFCFGHDGHIDLKYPVINPISLKDLQKWIKLICHKCGLPVIEDTTWRNLPKSQRLTKASMVARQGRGRKCVHCKADHPTVKNGVGGEKLIFVAEWFEEKKTREVKLYPHILKDILSRISDATVISLGKKPNSHPRNFILDKMRVSPTPIRPDVKKMGGSGRSNNDDLTTMIRVIIGRNDVIDAVIPEHIDPQTEKAIFDLNNACYDLVLASGEGALKSLAERLKGKSGRFRQTQMGKRVRNMCRSTITGDPSLKIDEVGVPMLFAKTVQVEETVQEYNRARLLSYINNGRAKYPGCTRVKRIATGNDHNVEAMSGFELENGDIVYRDLVNGDPVCFNRQPSLLPSNITMMRAVITEDPSILTLRMNVLATPYFNADFDGDAMNLIISSSVSARNEVSALSNAAQWFISHKSGGPALGQVEDSVVGMAELTHEGMAFNRYHAALVFGNTTFVPELTEEIYTGRDLVTLSLVDSPVNFKRVPTYYQANMTPYLKYHPEDISVEIVRGVHRRGVLDKKSIGKGAEGGLYHIIANEYGPRRALDVMFNHQQMAIASTLQTGFTIGLRDMIISAEAKAEVDRIAGDIINRSKLITGKLNNGEIIPPIGTTVEQFVEAQQIEVLKVFGDFSEAILKDVDAATNNLLKLVIYGSKGALENIYNISSSVGQKLINGERIRQKFGHRRTLAYFSRFDTDPESRGYIPDSYMGGMSSAGYVFNAMAARYDLISKALSTSITGEQNRKSIKNLESIIVNNFRWCVKNRNVLQFVYGENGLDPRHTELISFITVDMTDAAFADYYGRDSAAVVSAELKEMMADKAHGAIIGGYLDSEWKAAMADRNKYREIFMRVESTNTKHFFESKRRISINVERTYRDVVGNDTAKITPADFRSNLEAVSNFCKALPYIFLNEIQEAASAPVPEYLIVATWLPAMAIRTYLNCRILLTTPPKVLKIILDRLRLRYLMALVEPGSAAGIHAAMSFSEPLTQKTIDAHHYSALGGTSKSGMNRAKEVLGAQDVAKSSSPSMFIPLKPLEGTKEQQEMRAREIANNIEAMHVHQFVVSWQIFFEKFGAPEHPMYAAEAEDIANWLQLNVITPPGDLIRWCVRLLLDKTSLILKNMSLDLIITRLREANPNYFIVYTSENAAQCWIRIYFRSTLLKDAVTVKVIRKMIDGILDMVIRGVNEITYTTLFDKSSVEITADGGMAKKSEYVILTTGTNLRGLFSNPWVDPLRVTSDAIKEVERMFGIEAARQTVIKELRNIVDDIYHSHYTIYADEMTFNGSVTSIERGGLSTRETSNILLRVGFGFPIQTLAEAATTSAEDEVTGLTAPLLIGSIPRTGTLYNRFMMNPEYIAANVRQPDALLDEL